MKTAQQWQSSLNGVWSDDVKRIQVDVMRHVINRLLSDNVSVVTPQEVRDAWADKFDAESTRIELGVDL